MMCDYYLPGEGYQFSQASADDKVGIVILSDKYGSPTDVFYKNGGEQPMPAPGNLNWNWAQLNELIAGLANTNCDSVNNATVPTNSTGSIP